MAKLEFTRLGLESIRKLIIGEDIEQRKIKYIAVGSDNSPTNYEDTTLKNEIYRSEVRYNVLDDGTVECYIIIPEVSSIDGQEIGEIGLFNDIGLIAREALDPKSIKNPNEEKKISTIISIGSA